jgi:ribonuclease Z
LAGAKQLMLGHYSSRYNDETILQKEAAEVFENTILAKEGLVVTV